MKRSLFNFLVLQLIIWSVVFYEGTASEDSVNYAAISDTWEVAKVGDQKDKSFVLHYPTFQKLTLEDNGSFVRVINDEEVEKGDWQLNDDKTKLTLLHEGGVEEYEIIQLPIETSQSFIIKENIETVPSLQNIEYELTRM